MVPQTARTVRTSPPVADQWIAPTITSNATTKNASTRASCAMVKTIVAMVRMSPVNMVVVLPKPPLAPQENGCVPAWKATFVLMSKRFATINWTVPMELTKGLVVTTWNVTDMVVPMVACKRLMERYVLVPMAKF